MNKIEKITSSQLNIWLGHIWSIRHKTGSLQKKTFLHYTIWNHIDHWLISKVECVVATVLDFDVVEGRFELQSRYYVHFLINTFAKGMKPLIFPTMG